MALQMRTRSDAPDLCTCCRHRRARSSNNLSGRLGSLPGSIWIFDASSNSLSGRLPPLSVYKRLEAFLASGNVLQGGVPGAWREEGQRADGGLLHFVGPPLLHSLCQGARLPLLIASPCGAAGAALRGLARRKCSQSAPWHNACSGAGAAAAWQHVLCVIAQRRCCMCDRGCGAASAPLRRLPLAVPCKLAHMRLQRTLCRVPCSVSASAACSARTRSRPCTSPPAWRRPASWAAAAGAGRVRPGRPAAVSAAVSAPPGPERQRPQRQRRGYRHGTHGGARVAGHAAA